MDGRRDVRSVIVLNYRNIVEHLTFNDITMLIKALDLYDEPCDYDTVSVENSMQLLFLEGNQRHFNYLHLSVSDTFMYDDRLPLCNGLNSLKFVKCVLYDGIPVINSFDNMHSLVINGCNVHFITNLDNLIHLEVLNLGKNKIKRIENLSTLTNLRVLNLSKNAIKHIEGLNMLTNLRVLNLSENCISRIVNLDTLINLKYLNLSSTNLYRIENVDALVNLVYLNVSCTRVEERPDLRHLKKLLNFCSFGNPTYSI